jgi:peptidoglycan/LPS O-acetylase OafA/YrhL
LKPSYPISYRPDIDGLRAVAVLSVLFYHAFPRWIPGGYIGVDVFFVISGFLITSIIHQDLQTDKFSFSAFYARRIRRIFPALILILLAALIAGWFLLLPEAYKLLGKHVAAGAAFVSNFTLWKESGYFDIGANKKILLHLWSLSIEEQFYILWPLLLFVSFKKSWNLPGIILAIAVLSFCLNMALVHHSSPMVFYWPFFRFWELALGGLLAFGSKETVKYQKSWGEKASLTGLVLILAGLFVFKEGDAFPGWRALLPCLGTALLISSGQEAWGNKFILSRRGMVTLGLMSYPLYLWHWLGLSFLRNLSAKPHICWIWFVVIASFGLAWLTYQCLEKPLRLSPHKAAITRVLSFSMAAVFLLGLLVYGKQGFPERLPPYLRDISTIKLEAFQWEEKVRSGGCHVYDPALTENDDGCVEKKRPLVALWGDSYAAALYPGLITLQKTLSFGIAQLTASACPPLLDIHYSGQRNNCDEINHKILPRLARIKPDIILMSTTWDPVDYRMDHALYFEQLRKTIFRVKELTPQSRIYILGPVPRWTSPLQDCAVDYYREYAQVLPERTQFCLEPSTKDVDATMRAFAAEMKIGYVSLWDPLCNEQGCLTRVGPALLDLESIDGGHISSATSEFLKQTLAIPLTKLNNP